MLWDAPFSASSTRHEALPRFFTVPEPIASSFDAIVNRRIDLEGLDLSVRLADVEALNTEAFAGTADVTKLSYHAYAHCADRYVLLDAGSALGRGCGPLLISRRAISREEVSAGNVALRFWKVHDGEFPLRPRSSRASDRTALLFSDIEGALLDGRFDAGVIIHENRFTYEGEGPPEDRRPRRILGARDRRSHSARRYCGQPLRA